MKLSVGKAYLTNKQPEEARWVLEDVLEEIVIDGVDYMRENYQTFDA